MQRVIESIWALTPVIDRYSDTEQAPPVPFTEEDCDPTEECPCPTVKSPLTADDAYKLAQRALAEGRADEAKAYMQYVNMQTKRVV